MNENTFIVEYWNVLCLVFPPVVTCPALDNPVNGLVISDTPISGGSAVYFCNNGFTIRGPSFRTCGVDGEWTPRNPPVCTRKSFRTVHNTASIADQCIISPTANSGTVVCPTLTDPANGMIMLSTTTVGSTVTYTCNTGYVLDNPNSAERTCLPDGTWTGDDPMCNGE